MPPSIRPIATRGLAAAALAVLLAATAVLGLATGEGDGASEPNFLPQPPDDGAPSDTAAAGEPGGDDGGEVNQYNGTGNPIAVLETTMGTIRFELYLNLVPATAQNFIKLASSGFFDGIYFHRVIDDFVMQGGDPNTRNSNPCDDGWGGSSNTIPLEIHENLTHVDGAVGMARSSDPDSASSQFYICDGPQNNLDGDYAVFALVIEGIDVVRSVCGTDTYPSYRPCLKDHPVTEVTINSVIIEEGVVYPDENGTAGGRSAKGGGGEDGGGLPGPGTAALMIVIAIAATMAALIARNRRKGVGR